MPTILVKSGWQDINIGDIGHTPGLLALLERHVPGARLVLWPHDDSPAAEALLRKRFPDLEIVHGQAGVGMSAELTSVFQRADSLIHGSGPSLVARQAVKDWREMTAKPYGVYGISVPALNAEFKDLFDQAAFVFTRETRSLEVLREAKVASPHLGFAPDACVAVDVRDDERALAWMKHAGLEDKKFICAIPRNRRTPYHWSRADVQWSQAHIREVEDLNHRHREQDLAKLREAITRWVRATGMPVLLCPEMIDALALLGPHVYAPLPDDVRPRIILRDKWWMTDEAASIYARAFAVLSLDCHSPLIAYANGTPAVYVRQPQDEQKAHMYCDFGMSDWLMPIEETNGGAMAERMLEIYRDPKAAGDYLAQGMSRIAELHAATLEQALAAIGLRPGIRTHRKAT
jgi:hypothetical protein